MMKNVFGAYMEEGAYVATMTTNGHMPVNDSICDAKAQTLPTHSWYQRAHY